MKKTIAILFCISFFAGSAFSQQSVCKQDTVHFYQNGYRGLLTWQKSDNGTDWTPLPGSQKDTLKVIANSSAYYRTEVVDGYCKPYYSEAILLIVNQVPQVKLEMIDSVCLNDNAFFLDGGTPSGGSFWGTGVIDGKFSPSLAGTGTHKIHYRYSDGLSGCADTTFAFITVSPVAANAYAGSDLLHIPADSIQLNASIPVNGVGTWTLVNGSGGHFSDVHSANAWFVKSPSSLDYTLRWSISGVCGSSTDDVKISFFPLSKNPCPGTPTVTDSDGNVYPTIKIGDQCWMAKNLNVGRYVPSTVSIINHSDMSNNGIVEKYCLNNNLDSCKLYGGLYDWDEAMGYTDIDGAQGICPTGWHIATYADWNTLDSYFSYGEAGLQLKIGGDSGFEGHYAGDRHPQGEFFSNGSTGFFWLSGSYSFEGSNEGYVREIAACNGVIAKNHFDKRTGLSIRCIKNN